MSQANKDIAKAFFKALGAGDGEAMSHVLHPDGVAVAMGSSVMSGTRGAQEVIDTVGMLKMVTKNGIDFKIISMTAEDDRVSAEVEGYSTLRNGVEYNNVYHFLFTIQDGKIIRAKEYFCTKMVEEKLVPMAQSLAA
jgi:ketosteroid isomerase-like protein